MKQTQQMISLETVTNCGLLLYFETEQTPDICFAAVGQHSTALMFVKDQTREICLAAVMQCGEALMYVRDQTPEICMMAIMQNPPYTGKFTKFVVI